MKGTKASDFFLYFKGEDAYFKIRVSVISYCGSLSHVTLKIRLIITCLEILFGPRFKVMDIIVLL